MKTYIHQIKGVLSTQKSLVFLVLTATLVLYFHSEAYSFTDSAAQKNPENPANTVIPVKNEGRILAEPAPEAVFKDGNGKKIKISELKGKAVFINFWATWCMPCRAEMPTIAKLYDQFKDNKDIVFLMVDADDSYVRSEKYLTKKELDLPLYVPAGHIPYVYLSGAIPTTIMINKKGEIVFRHAGAADYSNPKMIEFVKKLIEGTV